MTTSVMAQPPYINPLIDLLKVDVSALSCLFSNPKSKGHVHEALTILRAKEPHFPEYMAKLILELFYDRHSENVAEILSACEPHERNLIFSHYLKIAPPRHQALLAALISPDTNNYFDIYLTLYPQSALVKQFIDYLPNDQCLLSFLLIPRVLDMVVNYNLYLDILICILLMKRLDHATQHRLIANRSTSDKVQIIAELDRESIKHLLPTLDVPTFRSIVERSRFIPSNSILAVLQYASDDQLDSLHNLLLPLDLQLPTHAQSPNDIIAFIRTLNESRRKKLLNAKIFSEGCSLNEILESIKGLPRLRYHKFEQFPTVIILACITDLKWVFPFLKDSQIAFIARYGTREQVLGLYEYLKDTDRENSLEAFFKGLPLKPDVPGQYNLTEAVTAYSTRLNNLFDTAIKAKEAFMNGDYDYKTVIKKLRHCYSVRKSFEFTTANLIFRDRAQEIYNRNLFVAFINLCQSFTNLEYRKDVNDYKRQVIDMYK